MEEEKEISAGDSISTAVESFEIDWEDEDNDITSIVRCFDEKEELIKNYKEIAKRLEAMDQKHFSGDYVVWLA